MLIYQKNISAKFHPDPIWNEVALFIFDDGRSKKKKKKKKKKKMLMLLLLMMMMSSYMISISDLKSGEKNIFN